MRCKIPLIAALYASTLCASLGQDGVAGSSKKVGAFRVEQFGELNALGDISYRTGTPIGIEAVQPEKETTIAFDFPGGSLVDLLNMFVSQVPDYRWEEPDDGVIHFFRSGAHVELLDVVMNYPGAYKKTRKEIWEDIANRPEICAWMNSSHCSRSEFFHGTEFKEHNLPISIQPGRLTLGQLLDKTAVKSGDNFWAVLQSPPSAPQCHISIILW